MTERNENIYNLNAEQMKKLFGELDTSKESFQNIGKKLDELSDTFAEAIKNGANKEVLDQIIGEWSMEKYKLDLMSHEHLKNADVIGRPDPMKEYIKDSYENLGKTIGSVNEQTKGILDNFKNGLIKGKDALTNAIKGINEKAKSLFKEGQEKIAEKFSLSLDNMKDKLSEKTVDAMVITAKTAEAFDRRHDRSKDVLQSGIKATIKREGELLDKNQENLAKKLQNISDSKFTKTSRIKAGVKTIGDAVKGKEFKAYEPEEKSVADIGREYQQAMKQASVKSKGIEMGTNVKINALKSWSLLDRAVANVGAKMARKASLAINAGIQKFGSDKMKTMAKEKGDDLNKSAEKVNDISDQKFASNVKEDFYKDIVNDSKSEDKTMKEEPIKTGEPNKDKDQDVPER